MPFCPLPRWVRTDLVAGYREERSPDVLAVAAASGLSVDGPGAVPWPAVQDGPDVTRVPIVFWGRGVDPSARVPAGTTLDRIAPTVAEAIGLHRAHPGVRSGVAIGGLAEPDRPTLVLEIALTGIGSNDVTADRGAWPTLLRLLHEGAGTLEGDTGSLPLDPAATLTTIGTGGLPYQHGVTGTLIRNDDGRVVEAWGPGSPPSVIATLPDDLDEATGNRALIGLVAPSIADRGLIGGTWYLDHDRDDVAVPDPGVPADPVEAARGVLARGYGADPVPDVLGVVLDGRSPVADRQLSAIVGLARRAAPGSLMVVVTATGSTSAAGGGLNELIRHVEDSVPGDAPVVAGVAAGGLFLDQHVLAEQHVSGQAVVDALLSATSPDGRSVVLDAFQGFAVSFARYC